MVFPVAEKIIDCRDAVEVPRTILSLRAAMDLRALAVDCASAGKRLIVGLRFASLNP